jgi:Asp/Glu/hydantoin racemase
LRAAVHVRRAGDRLRDAEGRAVGHREPAAGRCRCRSPVTSAIEKEKQYAAFVIACYSDPGLHSLREATRKPVLGISECGILTALTLGQKFGVIAILKQSIPRHLRYVGALGVSERLAGELPLGLRVVELSDEKKTFGRMAEVGKTLRDAHGPTW